MLSHQFKRAACSPHQCEKACLPLQSMRSPGSRMAAGKPKWWLSAEKDNGWEVEQARCQSEHKGEKQKLIMGRPIPYLTTCMNVEVDNVSSPSF